MTMTPKENGNNRPTEISPVNLADFYQFGWALIPQLLSVVECEKLLAAMRNLTSDRDPAGAWTLARHPEVLKYLRAMFATEMIPFDVVNKLTITQQDAGLWRDSLEFASIPANSSCVVLVALEDQRPSCGSLQIYNSTNTWPEWLPEGLTDRARLREYLSGLIDSRKPEPLLISLRAGHGIVLSSNLLYSRTCAADMTTIPAAYQITRYAAAGVTRQDRRQYQPYSIFR